MKKTILLFGFLLTVTCFTSFGENAKIEGGFGQKLGSVFDLKSIPADAKLYDQDGKPVVPPTTFFFTKEKYYFKPPKEIEGFYSFAVFVSEKSHLIYKIQASGYPSADGFTFQSVSKPAFNDLLAKLTNKYGPEVKLKNGATNNTDNNNEDSGLKDHKIQQGPRYVTIGFAPTQNGCTRITITYYDTNVKKQADKERKNHEAEPGVMPDPMKPQTIDKSDL